MELPIRILRKTLWWQEVDDPRPFEPDRFPVFITDSPAGEIYGFPVYGVPGLKIANHAGGQVVNPEMVDRSTHSGENRDCLELASRVARHQLLVFLGVEPRAGARMPPE